MSREIDILIRLQEVDNRIRQLTKQIETANIRRENLEQEFEKQATEIRKIQQTHKQANAERLKLEAKMAEVQSHIKRAERNLRNSHNQKEYEAAVREMDSLRKQLSGIETEMLEKIEIIEETEKILKERAEEIEAFEGKKSAALEEFELQLEKDKNELEIKKREKEELISKLTRGTAEVYLRLVNRSKDGIAVAKVVGESCSACFMRVRPQMIVELKRAEKIITCESCTRILYIASVEITA
ncbi:MAG: C4-type zinc ribbon domain-containing protein [Acidobacteriota bacterium]|nr:C4-type zinc ribbon domain-containing protein [Pyrinomonadaceae bacterium]MDW8304745.1 C4-type zinc ribbon domain-containing protein [Acidobacteriota bacterium]